MKACRKYILWACTIYNMSRTAVISSMSIMSIRTWMREGMAVRCMAAWHPHCTDEAYSIQRKSTSSIWNGRRILQTNQTAIHNQSFAPSVPLTEWVRWGRILITLNKFMYVYGYSHDLYVHSFDPGKLIICYVYENPFAIRCPASCPIPLALHLFWSAFSSEVPFVQLRPSTHFHSIGRIACQRHICRVKAAPNMRKDYHRSLFTSGRVCVCDWMGEMDRVKKRDLFIIISPKSLAKQC